MKFKSCKLSTIDKLRYWFFDLWYNRVTPIFKKSNFETWAEREVKLAIAAERKASGVEKGWDYGSACYKSALRALKSLGKDGHSGSSIRFTQDILNRLIEWKPLSPIEDTPDMWNYSYMNKETRETVYQNKRMSGLFKHVYSDGRIVYNDVDRVVCQDIKSGSRYQSGMIQDIIDEMYPIAMPYMPRTNKKYVVYCTEHLTDRKNGDYDTICVDHVMTPDGENVDIIRFFKESDNSDHPWQEIGYTEWHERINMQTERLKQEEYWSNFNGVIELENQDISWQDLTNGISKIASAAAHVGIDLGKGDNYES